MHCKTKRGLLWIERKRLTRNFNKPQKCMRSVQYEPLTVTALFKMATKMYQQGQQSLGEAQVLKETAESQLSSVRSQQAALQKQEKHLTQVRSHSDQVCPFQLFYVLQERLNFVKERKEQIQGTHYSSGTQGYYGYYIAIWWYGFKYLATVCDDVNNDDVILTSFDSTNPQTAPPTRSHMGNLLDQLDTSIQLRRIAMEAEQVIPQYQLYMRMPHVTVIIIIYDEAYGLAIAYCMGNTLG